MYESCYKKRSQILSYFPISREACVFLEVQGFFEDSSDAFRAIPRVVLAVLGLFELILNFSITISRSLVHCTPITLLGVFMVKRNIWINILNTIIYFSL